MEHLIISLADLSIGQIEHTLIHLTDNWTGPLSIVLPNENLTPIYQREQIDFLLIGLQAGYEMKHTPLPKQLTEEEFIRCCQEAHLKRMSHLIYE